MREVSQVYYKGFTVGLRPEQSVQQSTEHLMRSLNVLPTTLGLEPRPTVTDPMSEKLVDEFPFPALFVCTRHVFLVTHNALYTLTEDWEPVFVATYDWGGLPHVADFMDFVVLSSPTGSICVRDGVAVDEMGGAVARCSANFRGQLIVGDCALPYGPEKVGEEIAPHNVPVGGPNIVAWSKIGAIDWEYTLGNEVGWAPMPWEGPVLAILPLGDTVMVYGLDGVAKLSPASEPVTTFGVLPFGTIGVKNRHCVAGDDVSHVFLGADNNLYMVEKERALSDAGKTPKRLGYEEFLRELKDPIVSFDSGLRHWWIGDAKRCFIFNGQGLGESSETPTHLGRLYGMLCGCTTHQESPRVLVETGAVSFDSRGIKTLMCVESDLEAPERVYGHTCYRYSYSQPLRQSPSIRLDPRGGFFPIVAGTDIRVGFTCPSYKDFHLSKLWLHFKNTDKTFSRGVINAGRPAE